MIRIGSSLAPAHRRTTVAFALRSVALVAVVALAVPLSAQRTWVVDDTRGAGYDFTTLIAAYSAASDGDRIVVRYGTGSGYEFPMAFPTVFSKVLVVLGVGSAQPVILYRDAPISCPQYEVTVFDNLEFRAVGFSRFLPSVEFSRGTVVYSRCYFPPLNSHPSANYDAHRVIYVDCDIESRSPAVSVYGSDVLLLGCRTSSQVSRDNYGEGGAFIERSGTLRIVGGSIKGGDGYRDCIGYIRNSDPAVNVGQGMAFISGSTVLTGGVERGPCGNGGRHGPFSMGCGPPNAAAIDPLVAPGTNWPCPLIVRREMPAIIAGPAARGQPQTLSIWGPTQSVVAVFASLMTPYDPITLPFGDVWLDPNLMLHVGSGAVDAQRQLTLTTTVPSWLPMGDVLVYQAVSLSQQSLFEISAPGMAVVH